MHVPETTVPTPSTQYTSSTWNSAGLSKVNFRRSGMRLRKEQSKSKLLPETFDIWKIGQTLETLFDHKNQLNNRKEVKQRKFIPNFLSKTYFPPLKLLAAWTTSSKLFIKTGNFRTPGLFINLSKFFIVSDSTFNNKRWVLNKYNVFRRKEVRRTIDIHKQLCKLRSWLCIIAIPLLYMGNMFHKHGKLR